MKMNDNECNDQWWIMKSEESNEAKIMKNEIINENNNEDNNKWSNNENEMKEDNRQWI